jgi:hypothetical protein
VLERLVENWLTNAGERGYETAFAQLLAAEGDRVLQGPVHHPFEHGKDILSMSADGKLHAYQLKGPDLRTLDEFEKIQPQLLALAAAGITHPTLPSPRRPDRIFLVTSAKLTPPVRDRIEKFNVGNAANALPPIEPIELEQLTKRFVIAHGRYIPQELSDIQLLIELYYSDPATHFPIKKFAAYLTSLLPFPPRRVKNADVRRAAASAAILTAYASSGWQRSDNNLCVAQAWLTFCATLLRFASETGTSAELWLDSYDLGFQAARASLASLSREVALSLDCGVPHLAEGAVYGTRALLISGYLSAYLISERTLGPVGDEVLEHVRTALVREKDRVKISGESEVPALLEYAAALEQLGEVAAGGRLALSLLNTLVSLNQRHSPNALPDPYHDPEQVIAWHLNMESDCDGEEFDGRSYTLHIAVEWLARRLWRQFLAARWAPITRIEFLEFRPDVPSDYLAVRCGEGELHMWFAEQPQSWRSLLLRARTVDTAQLPSLLLKHREMLPYLPLIFPYRFTSAVAGAIDSLATDPAWQPPFSDEESAKSNPPKFARSSRHGRTSNSHHTRKS